MRNDLTEILYTEQQIAEMVAKLGEQITRDYKGKDLLVIAVLKGSNIFLADLIRKIDMPIEIDFIAVSSYGKSTKSSGVVKIIKDLDYSIEGKNVLIIEDIIDSGLTLHYLMDNFMTRNPESLEVCTLLDKPEKRVVDTKVKYSGFNIPDVFIVGYGLDYAEKYRNLPYVGVLDPKVYS